MSKRISTVLFGAIVLFGLIVIIALRQNDDSLGETVEQQAAVSLPVEKKRFPGIDHQANQNALNEPSHGTSTASSATSIVEPEAQFDAKRSGTDEGRYSTWKAQLPEVEEVLGLHSEEYEQLLSVLVDFDARLEDVSRSTSYPERIDAEKKLHEERARTLEKFFGAARNREWLQYLETTGIRAQVRILERALAKSSPLFEDQRVSLLDSLIDTNQRYQAAKDQRDRDEPRKRRSADEVVREYEQFSKTMYHAAAPYLSSAQLREYDKILRAGGPSVEEAARAL